MIIRDVLWAGVHVARCLDEGISFSVRQQRCPSGSVRVVGAIRPGLPPWTASTWLPLRIPLMDLLVTAASMTAVSLLEALSIARALADSLSSRPDPARELLGTHDRQQTPWQLAFSSFMACCRCKELSCQASALLIIGQCTLN